MTLSQQHRSTIYQQLVPIFGPDEAEAFMAEFPATENDELVTKQFLRAELAEVRSEIAALGGDLRAEMAALRGELRGEMATLRGEVQTEITNVRGDLKTVMATLRGELFAEMQRLNNRSLMALLPTLIAGMGLAAAIN